MFVQLLCLLGIFSWKLHIHLFMQNWLFLSFSCFLPSDEIYGNSLISSMIDSCNCSDSSDIELSDDWVGKKSPKISRGSKSPKLPR